MPLSPLALPETYDRCRSGRPARRPDPAHCATSCCAVPELFVDAHIPGTRKASCSTSLDLPNAELIEHGEHVPACATVDFGSANLLSFQVAGRELQTFYQLEHGIAANRADYVLFARGHIRNDTGQTKFVHPTCGSRCRTLVVRGVSTILPFRGE